MKPRPTERRASTPEPGPRRGRVALVVPVLLIVVGLVVLLYPVFATQWNNLKQIRAAEAYSQIEQGAPPAQLDAALARAHVYNETRALGAILDPWLARVSEDNVDYQEYLAQLNQQSAMGRILVPSGKIDLPIYHGTTEEVLQKGVGHLYGSDLPIGGVGTHAALTGHTGLANATLFDNLDDVRIGDAIYIAVSGERLKYEVEHIETVLPEEVDGLTVQPAEDLVTLITCTPYGINTHRILVRAHRVPMDAADQAVFDEGGALSWQWWMWAILAGAVVVLAGLVWWLRRMFRGHPEAAGDTPTSNGRDGLAGGVGTRGDDHGGTHGNPPPDPKPRESGT